MSFVVGRKKSWNIHALRSQIMKFFRENGFVHLRNQLPQRMQTHIAVPTSVISRNKKVSACKCQTKPAIYLENRPPKKDAITSFTDHPKFVSEEQMYKARQRNNGGRRDQGCDGEKCCKTTCKTVCFPCICLAYSCAALDYCLGRCLCGPDYASKLCGSWDESSAVFFFVLRVPRYVTLEPSLFF